MSGLFLILFKPYQNCQLLLSLDRVEYEFHVGLVGVFDFIIRFELYIHLVLLLKRFGVHVIYFSKNKKKWFEN